MATKHEAMERDFCAAFDGIACLVVDHARFQCRGRTLDWPVALPCPWRMAVRIYRISSGVSGMRASRVRRQPTYLLSRPPSSNW